MAKNIGATLVLKEGNFFTNIKNASQRTEELKKKLATEEISDEEVDAILGQINDINKARLELAGRINRLIV